jgi:hypothetical protein
LIYGYSSETFIEVGLMMLKVFLLTARHKSFTATFGGTSATTTCRVGYLFGGKTIFQVFFRRNHKNFI